MWPFFLGAILAGIGAIVWNQTRGYAEKALGSAELAAQPYTKVTMVATDQSLLAPVGKLVEVDPPPGGVVVNVTPATGGVASVKKGVGQIVVTSMSGPGNYDFTVWWTPAGGGAPQKTVLHLTASTDELLPAPGAAAAPAAAPTQPPAALAAVTLQAGHRYQVLQLAPVPGAAVSTPEQAQALFDRIFPGAVQVVAITPASGASPTSLVLDVLSAVPMTLPPTMPITDLGPTPASPATSGFFGYEITYR